MRVRGQQAATREEAMAQAHESITGQTGGDAMHPAPATTASAADSLFSMPLVEAMTTQRAIRRFKPDAVDDSLVLRLIELAQKAPTGSNQQNWEFIVVRDRAVKERLGTLNRQMFTIYGAIGRRVARNDPKMLRIIEAV